MLAEIEQRNMEKESPVLVRIFKEESELEVWKQDRTGRLALLKTYPICRWSGELGPKVKMGDRQAPEGFYTITPGLMNPNSNYYLAINTGFPNAYDRANGHTGEFLMIHGDCSSAGCYAMTDEQIGEIYALARESFLGGQHSFQIQAYPFRMTALNMARHRDSPSMPFWRMIKEGYDHFEVTRLEPKVDVCEKHYVFNAETKGGFSPAGKCPAYKVNDELAAAVAEKEQDDDRQAAQFASQGTPTVPVRAGTDGGMHPTFLAAFRRPSAFVRLPGTIPPHARPPGEPNAQPPSATTAVAAVEGMPNSPGTSRASSSAANKETASEDQPKSGSVFARLFGFGGAEASAAPAADSAPKAKPKETSKITRTASVAKPKPTYELSSSKTTPATAPASHTEPKPASPPAAQPPQEANAEPASKTATNAGVLSGAHGPIPSGSFDGRWGVFR
jgi:murein L,D-transpeptidase YafK